MKERAALVVFLSSLVLSACAQPPTPIAFEGRDKARVLRCTLRPEGPRLVSSNFLGLTETIRAGSPAKIEMFSTQRVDLNLNNISYQMFPATTPFSPNPQEFLKKYFVDSAGELGLNVPPARKANIENGVAEIGMTKQEVYAALGPPLWVDFENDASAMTLEALMEKNRWVYRVSQFGFFPPVTRVFMFDEGKLRQTIP